MLVKFDDNNYYFLATSTYADDVHHTLNFGDTFAIFDRWGDINPIGKQIQGIYHRGTRFISDMQLRLNNDERPSLLSSNIKYENELLSVDLTNPTMKDNTAKVIEQRNIHISRTKFLQDGTCYELINLHNYDTETYTFHLKLSFKADFKDIFEIRGLTRKKRGTFFPTELLNANTLQLTYEGLDNKKRRTVIRFYPTPAELQKDVVIFNITLYAKQTFSIHYNLEFHTEEKPILSENYTDAFNKIEHFLKKGREIIAHIHTSNAQFNHWLNRAKNDLVSLLTQMSGSIFPYAGVPWYNTIFGRDGIITALSTLWIAPDIAKGVLLFLADKQALDINPVQDAEPGKILHEMRYGEMAATGEVPFGQYYGSIDATPLFIVLAGQYLKRTNDISLIKNLWPNIIAALKWIDQYGDIDKDGLIEYERKTVSGLVNQGWKDSQDSISYEDGRLADTPIALCEVQGYVYDAKLQASYIAKRFGDITLAQTLTKQAEQLKQKFNEQFWDDDLGTYVLALDGHKKPCRVLSSNAGHCLFSGIATLDKAKATAQALMSQNMFTGWGIRTLSKTEVRYNPISYHNGSVWPHDTAIIAAGFARYGMTDKALQLMNGLFDASLFIDLQRLPELFCGFDYRKGEAPTAYPVACSPQAWAVASVFLLLQACLQITIDAADKKITFNKPQLPVYLEELRIFNLQLGKKEFELEIFRYEHDLGIHVLKKPAGWQVVVIR